MREESRAREMFRSGAAGCLAIPVGFILSGLVLTPLWAYWLFQAESAVSAGPTLLSLVGGAFYAAFFGVAAAAGLPVRWWVAISLIALGVVIGLGFASLVRATMLESCLLGTGPQPDWCSQQDPAYLRPIPYAYGIAGGLLGLLLYMAGGVGTKLRSSVADQGLI